MEQYISKTVDAKNVLPCNKLMNLKNSPNDSVNMHWPNNTSVAFTNGSLSCGSGACDFVNSASVDVKCEYKSDIDRTEVSTDKFEQDELLDMFREIKKEWYVSFLLLCYQGWGDGVWGIFVHLEMVENVTTPTPTSEDI